MASITLASVAHAQTTGGSSGGGSSGGGGGGNNSFTLPDCPTTPCFGGAGLLPGAQAPAGVGGIAITPTIADLITLALSNVLTYVLLFAMITVIIAGLYLIFSNGDEGQKDKAKKIITYTVIGIAVIILARVLVVFINGLFF